MSVEEGDELGREGAGRAWAALSDEEKSNLIAAVKIAAVQAGAAGFTSDAVWALLDNHGITISCDRRALGAAFTACAREGYITATDEWRKSERAVCHANPKRVWVRT